jgi:hypothetical protein
MLKLNVVQAEFGDCFVLRFGSSAKPQFILIDGGPSGTYTRHLQPEIEKIRASGNCLELLILSHVDNDHIIGLLEMMADVVNQRAARQPNPLAIRSIWHNAFQRAEGHQPEIIARLDAGLPGPTTAAFSSTNAVTFGINEGNKLLLAAQELGIPVNPGVPGAVITTQTQPKPIQIADLKLWVIGPTPQNLERLREKWLEWLEKYEKRAPFADEIEADKIDRSVPNLSSIMLLVQSGRRKILLTGDGTSDDVLEGLRQQKLLNKAGKLSVDVLKLPHHGSARNIRKAFFDVVTAKTYIISANGKYNNPDLATLIWLVSAVKEQRRAVKILATNMTDSIRQLVEEYPPERYGYALQIMDASQHAIEI